ncbi:MAG: guanylate kinase [Rhodospirillaceae bacterium]|nr:guanylate kinase [Alphaproteobacteria bacterium]MBR73131.1 guanylate kinase [Rhodospirillaceae bacterium]|tara:strand:- start:3507 stop:4139 length:633 start_codon:yes stop_codon:yes gene_type:complete
MEEMTNRRGIMLVLSSPSGAGKTTITRRLLESVDSLEMSVSVTTRPKRSDEIEGRDYSFVDDEKFEKLVSQGAFLEYATVFGRSYGTPREPVEAALGNGRDIIFDIDWQGHSQLVSSMANDVVSVFILPPSLDELEQRLRRRAQDVDNVVASRMAKASDEMSHFSDYHYVVINRSLDEAVESVTSILLAERYRRERQTGLQEFVLQLKST